MAQYTPPPTRVFRNANGLAQELQQAIEDAEDKRDEKTEVKEARQTREALRNAKSALQSKLDGNKTLLTQAGYGDLVTQVEDLVSRLDEAIQEATTFINNSSKVDPITAPQPSLPDPVEAQLSGVRVHGST